MSIKPGEFQDAFGNVQGTVYDSVNVAQQITYSDWGAPSVTGDGTEAGAANRLAWKGLPYDAVLGLTYMRARWYDPAVGRFVSEDPLGLSAGINPYLFAEDDPINGSDPSGMNTCVHITTYTWYLGKYKLFSIEIDHDPFECGGTHSGRAVPDPKSTAPSGGTSDQNHNPAAPYPYKPVKQCPDFLQSGQPIRSGLEQLYHASRQPEPHEEAIAFFMQQQRVNFLTVGVGTCEYVSISPDIGGLLPVGSFMFAHSHPCAGMDTGHGSVYGQGPDYGDVGASTTTYQKPGAIISRDSIFWYNPDGKAYGCAR